jgi:hypothetical protein
MPGCERMALEWGRNMLVREIHRVTTVMPVERARAILDHKPDVLVCFTTGSRANQIVLDRAALSGVPVHHISVGVR